MSSVAGPVALSPRAVDPPSAEVQGPDDVLELIRAERYSLPQLAGTCAMGPRPTMESGPGGSALVVVDHLRAEDTDGDRDLLGARLISGDWHRVRFRRGRLIGVMGSQLLREVGR